jgi:hypothetical protein
VQGRVVSAAGRGHDLAGQVVRLRGEIEVFGGEAAGVVRDKGKPHAIVANVDVWVVAVGFSGIANLIHEAQRGNEVLELEGPDELARVDLPAWEGCEARVGFFG